MMRSKTNIFVSMALMSVIFLTSVPFTFAYDEGMYPSDQIARLPLVQRGLKIKPIDIYNPKGGGLSEAVVSLFFGGGGCTAEFVSPEGLILTNHHCGLDALVAASTPAKDYGQNGYKADSRANELPAEGYTLRIPTRTEDITSKVLAGTESLTGEARDKAIQDKVAQMEKDENARAGQDSTVRIQALNNGFFYYLYETTELKDIRVVYAPPLDIGFFGGDPDNFEWTRHTGDFTFLRAYVAPDGKAATYSPNNIPYKPKKFLPISLNGLKENDFLFIMGYPGGTTRYRESQSINYSEQVNFPFLRDFYKSWAGGVAKVGETNEEKRVKLLGDYNNYKNSEKVFEGGVVALRRGDVVAKRQAEELKLSTWINATPARKAKYGPLLPDITAASADYYKTAARDRVTRTFPNAANTPVFKQVFDAIVAVQQGTALTDKKRAEIAAAFKDREPIMEREMIKFFLLAAAQLPDSQKIQPIETIFSRYKGNSRRSAEESFAELIAEKADFDSPEKIIKLYSTSLNDIRRKYPDQVEVILTLAQEQAQYAARLGKFNGEINNLRLLYLQAMSEMKNMKPYPDANFTQRFSYGNVKGYAPREAVVYKPFTTLKGVIEKDSGVFPFIVPQKLKDLQKAKDFGRFGEGDSVPVNFLATLDIIGGNSGSPVMNAFGEQVGIAFDGNYEGLGNDLFFSPDYGRTIVVDIRYVLFVTEKFGGAGWILNEMKLNRGRAMKATK